jgi:hypothetical protein
VTNVVFLAAHLSYRLILLTEIRIGCEDVYEIHLAQDGVQWRAVMNTVMNLQVPRKVEHLLTVRRN